MKTITRACVVLALIGAGLGMLAWRGYEAPSSSSTYRPELEYFKAVNKVRPPGNPEVVLLLMAQYANANLHAEGIEYFSSLLERFAPQLSVHQQALYRGGIGVLRAGYAKDVPIWKRFAWVKDTIAILERAKQDTGGEDFIVRWMSGVVYAQLPGLFNQQGRALEDLRWCLDHARLAPHAGWLREVYYQLAVLHHSDGQQQEAQGYLRNSGYDSFDKPITLTTPYSEDLLDGHAFAPRRITEVVPKRVYTVSGYEFTEYYFVVSEDGRELIGIDAGTRPDSAETVYKALRAYAPNLPPLTAILITHAHWDHVGGHQFFRSLKPRPTFYARENYRQEIARQINAPPALLKTFFGERFSPDDVRSFQADVEVARTTEMTIGGTRIELIPIQGGETSDALLINLPDQSVMFVGDFIMPYLGAPFLEEGDLDGLLDAIDIVARKNPRHLLHGHEPLTRLFMSTSMLVHLKPALAWLQEQVVAAVQLGDERASVQQANLIPPDMFAGDPEVLVPYLVMRENIINRLFDQYEGYWQADFHGMDYVSKKDQESLLIDYLGLSEDQLVRAVKQLLAEGNYELAATAIGWTGSRFMGRASIQELRRLTYLKLMEKYQDINPFKFIIYSGIIGEHVPQMRPTGIPATGGSSAKMDP